METSQTQKPGFSEPPHELRPAAFEEKAFGWRHSTHLGWMHLKPGGYSEYDGWTHDASEFLCRLGEENPRNAIKVVAQSRDGELIKEILVDPADFDGAQLKLLELEPESVNLLFDPVPWVEGRRKKKTRFGWITLSGVHPLDMFPEPVIYWAVGPFAFQALLPWHMPLNIEHSCELACDAPSAWSPWAKSEAGDLLVMPGSIIHAGHLPPFTALVKYDMFSVSEVDGKDDFLQRF